jgi:hypothetical protein
MVRSTDSFTITLKDTNNANIAIDTSTYLDASVITSGNIVASAIFSTSVVQRASNIEFVFTPTHDLIKNASFNPVIKITLPSTIDMPGACVLTGV